MIYVYGQSIKTYFHMSVNQPVELKIFIIISKRINQLFSNLKQPHVEKELEDGEDGDVKVDVQWQPSTRHPLVLPIPLELLSADDGEDEEDVGGEGDHLSVDHGYGDPVVAPQ